MIIISKQRAVNGAVNCYNEGSGRNLLRGSDGIVEFFAYKLEKRTEHVLFNALSIAYR